MAEHSPLPWVACTGTDGPHGCCCGYIFAEGGIAYVAKALRLSDDVDPVASPEVAMANQLFIVEAVNNHARIASANAALRATIAQAVEALRKISKLDYSFAATNGCAFDAVSIANAAIAACESVLPSLKGTP